MNKQNRGIPKETGYKIGIFCHEYDLEAMIIAFGHKSIIALADELHARLKKNKRLNRAKKEKLNIAA